jgi:hypothetical protein
MRTRPVGRNGRAAEYVRSPGRPVARSAGGGVTLRADNPAPEADLLARFAGDVQDRVGAGSVPVVGIAGAQG